MAFDWYKVTDDVDDAHLGDHGIAVDLAHVAAGVFALGLAQMQRPGAVAVVRRAETRNPRHQMLVDGHDHLTVQMNPRHLFNIILRRQCQWNWFMTSVCMVSVEKSLLLSMLISLLLLFPISVSGFWCF